MSDPCKERVVGGSGLHNPVGSGLYTAADLDGPYSKLGHSQLTPFSVLRQPKRLAIAANHGLWEWRRDLARYR